MNRLGRIDRHSARFDGAGALIVDATPAPYDVVLPYDDHNEFRSRAEVTSKESLDSWRGLPLVRLHDWITADNVQKSIGYVREVHDGGDGWLHSTLVVVDALAIADINAGRLVELSGGYNVDGLFSGGVWDGMVFHVQQTKIRMNHLGAGPSGWARAGAGARIL